MIQEIISAGEIQRSPAFLICGVVFFDGKWTTVFDRSATRVDRFDSFGVALKVPLMLTEGDYRYAYVDGVQIVEKDYSDCPLAMMIILPAKGEKKFTSLRAGLTAEKIASWSDLLGKRRVQLHLPRFKMDSFVNVLEPLKALSVSAVFDASGHPFEGMSDAPLYVSRIIHKAVIECNEEGTRAAAATGIGGAFGGMSPVPPPSVDFRADHPFVFLIRDRETGAILFLGQVIDPPTAKGDG